MYLQDIFHMHLGVKFVYKREDAMTHVQRPGLERVTTPVDALPLVEMGYTFIEQLKILDVCWADQSIAANVVVPVKGPDHYAVAWVLKRLQKWGLREIRVRTDPETSIAALAKAVVTASPFDVKLDTTPVQSHQSIGHVERAHRIVQEQIRAKNLEIEGHVNMKLNLTIPLGNWLVRHASWQIF